MDITNIISRLEVIIDDIEYEESSIIEVQDGLKLLVSDIEALSNFDSDFGDIMFNELD